MTIPFPEAALRDHIASLGKTGSGKTSDTKVIVEHITKPGWSNLPKGARVCILDAIKSDWWGITSSANGKAPGRPFHILGGPHGHVPLHSSSGKVIGELVASGALPLSILDMADFEPGGLQRFFSDFAQALFKKNKGVLYLVVEEAHEFAPKERSGMGAENMSIHWMKKLATAGRTKGIRLIVCTQRTQALHNAVLGSCETMIAGRFTAPADQAPVLDWFKANVSKEKFKEIAASLSSLKTGQAWVACGEADFLAQVQFPRITTYDNTATPEHGAGDVSIKTAPVDLDRLRAVIGDAVKDAEANDPKALKARVAELEAENKKLQGGAQATKPVPAAAIDKAATKEAEARGYAMGFHAGAKSIYPRAFKDGFDKALELIWDKVCELANKTADDYRRQGFKMPKVVLPDDLLSTPAPAQATRTAASAPTITREATGLPGNHQRILDSLLTWRAMGHTSPSNAQVAWLARYSPTSTSYTNPRGALKSAGLVEYPAPDRVELTPDGEKLAGQIDIGGDLLAYVLNQLPGNERRVLEAVAHFYPKAASNDDVAARANYSPSSTSFTNPRGALKTKDLLTYPGPGQVRAADWLFQ